MKHLLTGLFIFFCSFAFSQGAWDRWVTTSGTNTYTATVTVPTFPSSYNNTVLRLKFPNSNTGASTINVNSTGAIPIRKWDGDSWEPLVSGDIPANSSALLYYDNTNAYYSAIIFESIGGSGSTPTLQEVLTAGSVLTGTNTITGPHGINIEAGESVAGVRGLDMTANQFRIYTDTLDLTNGARGFLHDPDKTLIVFDSESIQLDNTNGITLTTSSASGIKGATIQLSASAAATLNTRQMVGEYIASRQFKESVRVASTANIADLNNAGSSIDGVTLTATNRVLLKDQSTASQNGIYIVSSTGPVVLSRANDFASSTFGGLYTNTLVFVNEGSAGSGKAYRLSTTGAITIGSTSLTFTEFGAGGGGGTWGSITGTLSSQTDLQSALDLKAPLASPTFTGTPAAPTASPGTNTTQLATTAYTDAAVTAAALPAADASNDGYLTQTDWSTFNSKLSGNETISFAPTGDVTGTTTGTTSLAPVLTIGAAKVTNSMLADPKYSLASGGTLSGANTITGTTTNTVKYIFNSLGVTQTNGAGLWLANTTAATSGNQQESPSLVLEGQGFATGLAQSQSNKWVIRNLPVQGSLLNSSLLFQNSVNGVAYSTAFTLTGSGPSAPTFGFTSGASISAPSNTMTIQAANAASPGVQFNHTFTTAGTNSTGWRFNNGFAPTSGTSTWKGVVLDGTINQTGGASGDATILEILNTVTNAGGNLRGIDINPTLTAVAGATYPFVSRPTTGLNGFGTGTPTAMLHVVGATKLEGSVTLPVAGNGLLIKEGANATMGTATLSGGTITVNTTKATATSRIFLTVNGGTLTNVGSPYVSARSAGTSFTISSTNASDVSDVAWIIIEPAP
jgi:hypothetical protein